MNMAMLNPGIPEPIFVAVRAAEGSAIPKDAVLQLDISTAGDGSRAVQPNTGELIAFVGVAAEAIPDGEVGLAQTYGYRGSSQVFQTDTSQAAGTPLVPVAGQYRFATVATSTASTAVGAFQPIFAFLFESVASSSASAVAAPKIFIRSM